MTGLTYETKCRRCGVIHEWAYIPITEGLTDFQNWQKLHSWVWEHLAHPSVNNCRTCGMKTIQDYVSYSERPKE